MKSSNMMHDMDENRSSQSKVQNIDMDGESIANINGSDERSVTNCKPSSAYYEASQLASGGLHYTNRDVGGSAISLSAMLEEEEGDTSGGNDSHGCKRTNSSGTLLQRYSNAAPGVLKKAMDAEDYSEDGPGIPMSPLRNALTETLNTWSFSLIMVW